MFLSAVIVVTWTMVVETFVVVVRVSCVAQTIAVWLLKNAPPVAKIGDKTATRFVAFPVVAVGAMRLVRTGNVSASQSVMELTVDPMGVEASVNALTVWLIIRICSA